MGICRSHFLDLAVPSWGPEANASHSTERPLFPAPHSAIGLCVDFTPDKGTVSPAQLICASLNSHRHTTNSGATSKLGSGQEAGANSKRPCA